MKVWIKPIKIEIKRGNSWAKLRIKNDKKFGQYIDVLSGKNGIIHSHVGYCVECGETLFIQPRKQIHSLEGHKLTQNGVEKKTVFEDQTVNFSEELVFKAEVNRQTWELTITEFKFRDIDSETEIFNSALMHEFLINFKEPTEPKS